MTRLIPVLAMVGLILAGCAHTPATGPGNPAQPPKVSAEDVKKGIELACFTLQAADAGFQIYAATAPGKFSAEDMSNEGAAMAGVIALCRPPYDFTNYQAVIAKILETAKAVTVQIRAAPP